MNTETTNTDSSYRPLLELEYGILMRNHLRLQKNNEALQMEICRMKRIADAWNGKKQKVTSEIKALWKKLKEAEKEILRLKKQ